MLIVDLVMSKLVLLLMQGRVRECLVNLLNTCGQKVGLPKSPSVSSDSGGVKLPAWGLYLVIYRFTV
jgi:hypothetical protein